MNSEKVKEIKKKLQQINVNDILTLINELESENERLKWEKQTLEDKDTLLAKVGEMVQENKQLKDRIAELECSLSKKTMEYELLKCGKKIGDGIVEVIDEAKKSLATYEALKQFAERLKEKCEWNKKQYCCEETVSANDIDETLKEFIND